MLKGVGIDIVEIGRISRMVETYGDLFLCKVFTEKEIFWCRQKAVPAIHFAGRWAAKEAFYKALPDQLQPFSSWKSIEILPEEGNSKPRIIICEDKLLIKMQSQSVKQVHLSISHEKSVCTAIVIIE